MKCCQYKASVTYGKSSYDNVKGNVIKANVFMANKTMLSFLSPKVEAISKRTK